MKESGLQFKNPRLLGVEFEINRDFDNSEDESIDIKLGFNIDVHKSKKKLEAIVELTVTVGAEDNTSPFYIKATEGAVFRWSDEMKKMEDKLLEQNAPAILLGYLRPIIAMLTAASPFEAYNIPLINFTK